VKILLVVLVVLGAILSVLVWFLGPGYGLDSWVLRAGIAALLVLPIPGVLGIRAFLKRRRASEAQRPQASAASRAQVKDCLERLTKVLNASKVSGGEDLSLLPWALLIGPRGSGKTGLLVRSRLEIPFATAKAEGPADFEAYLTRAGVVLDVGGRSYGPPGSPELIDLREAVAASARAHPRKRLDAVVLALDFGAILEGAAEAVERIAADARGVLESVRDACGYNPPVYLVLSKADRVPGLADAYGVLQGPERGQVLGIELNAPGTAHAKLTALSAYARAQSNLRLGQLDPRFRSAVVIAHGELAAAGPRISTLVEAMFQPSSLGEVAKIAGVYWASTEQDGRTVSLLDQQLGFSSFPAPPREVDAKVTKRSYFVMDLWSKVVLGSPRKVERSAMGLRRRRAEATAWLGGAAVFAAVWAGWATLSFANNRALLTEAQTAINQAASPRSDEPEEVERHLRGVAALATEVRALANAEREGPPLLSRSLLYVGDELLRPLSGLLDEHMRTAFVEPASTDVETALLDAKGSEDVSKDYDLLRAYLMVTDARQHLDVDQAAPVWLTAWQTQLHPSIAQNRALLEPLVRTYLELLGRGFVKWRPTNAEAIQVARRSAIARGAEFQRLVADAARDTQVLTLSSMLGSRYADVMSCKESIRGLYTLQGWRKVRGILGEKPEGASGWVLEQFANEDELLKSLEQEYMAGFRSEWTRFLGGIALVPAFKLAEAGKLLEGLTSGDPLYHVLVRRMKLEMAFPTVEEEAKAAALKEAGNNPVAKQLAEKVLPKRPANEVQQFFQPLLETIDAAPSSDGSKVPEALPLYTAKLAELATAIKAFASDEKADVASLEPTVAEARARATDILRRFDGRDRLRAVLEPLLLNPLSGAVSSAREERAIRRAGTFASSVCDPYYESLGGKYPFALRKEEALLDDVVSFFGPSGAVKSFYESTLSKDLIPSGDDWVVDSGHTVDPDIVEFYRVAMKVGQVFFPGSAADLAREFQVLPEQVILPPKNPPKVSGFTLEVGDVKQTYEFGAERTWSFAWPTKIGRARLALLGRGDLSSIETTGDWAWFRLIDRASKSDALEGGWHRVSWFLDGVEIRVRVRTQGRYNPLFEARLFQRLECRRR